MSLSYFNLQVRRGSRDASVDTIVGVQYDVPFSFIATTGLTNGRQALLRDFFENEPTGATNLLDDVNAHQSDFHFSYPVNFGEPNRYANYYDVNSDKGLFRLMIYAKQVSYATYPYQTVNMVKGQSYINQNGTTTLVSEQGYFQYTNSDLTVGIPRLYLGCTTDGYMFMISYGMQAISNISDTLNAYSDAYVRWAVYDSGSHHNKLADYMTLSEDAGGRYPTTNPNTGTYNPNDESDEITTPTIPAINSSVFTHVYKMNTSLLTAFKEELFSDSFWDSIKKWFTKPMDSIVALNIVPLALEEITDLQAIQVGTKSMATMGYLASGTVFRVNCGYVDINEYYENFADYEQTIIQCYVPYVGFIPIKTVDVMGGRLSLEYLVNIVTGDFVAFLSVERDKFNVNLKAVLYETSGNMFAQIPVTSSDYSNVIQGVLNTITSTATTVASAMSGNVAGMVSGGTGIAQGVAQSVSAPAIQRSGGYNKNASICNMRKPFILIERPRIAIADTLQRDKGFTANYSATIGTLTGYTEVRHVNLDGIDLTANEKARLESILKTGFYI